MEPKCTGLNQFFVLLHSGVKGNQISNQQQNNNFGHLLVKKYMYK